MPSSSKAQHNFMEAIAHSPSFAKKVGVPQSVGKDFSNADKGKTFSKGGDMATKMDPKMLAMMMAKKKGMRPPMPSSDMGMSRPGGMPTSATPMMSKGGMTKMAGGGMPMKDGKPAFIGDGKGAMNKGGMAKKMMGGGMTYAKGGGIESKGKTKGKMIKMTRSGMAC